MSLFSAMTDENSVWSKGTSLFSISSPLNDLLESDNFTLDMVLKEDELIQEVKTRNAKLLEFLSQEENVLKLIEYVTRPSPDPEDPVRTHKYPYMACEVMCCDIPSITDTLASSSSSKVAESLFEFLYQPAPLDPRLAGYFEKIVSMLMVRKPQEMTALLNRNTDKLMQAFVHHTQSFSISELLKRLLQPFHSDYEDAMDFPGIPMTFPTASAWYGGGPDDDSGSVGTPTSAAQKSLSWQQDTTVVDLLVANLQPIESSGAVNTDIHKHSADVLIDIVHCGTRAQQNDPSSPHSTSSHLPTFVLLEHLETKEVVEKLVALAIPNNPEGSVCLSSMTSALSVLSALLARHSNTRYSTSDELPPAVECTIARLPQICATLRAEDHEAGQLCNQRRQQVARLGLRRLKLVGLVTLFTQTKFSQVDKALLAENAVDVCLDLFFKFESVNMLHADIESMVVGILESGGNELQVALIQQGRFLERILGAYELNEEALAKPKGFALGFMGHLNRICHMLVTLADDVRDSTTSNSASDSHKPSSLHELAHADSVIEMLESDPLWARWIEFSSTVLGPIYDKERLPLGGVAIAPAMDDPYAVLGLSQGTGGSGSGGVDHQSMMLSSQFADDLEILNYPGATTAANDSDMTFFGACETPMLPEILNDSSSSDSEDDDTYIASSTFHKSLNDDDDDDDGFGRAGATTGSTTVGDGGGSSSNSWANFDQAAFSGSSGNAGFDADGFPVPVPPASVETSTPPAPAPESMEQ